LRWPGPEPAHTYTATDRDTDSAYSNTSAYINTSSAYSNTATDRDTDSAYSNTSSDQYAAAAAAKLVLQYRERQICIHISWWAPYYSVGGVVR
jgi:hypothetical protein